MPLDPETRLGPYEIVRAIGAGGMGEVYRARDPRLGRDVAVKALPELFAADPERTARFKREAQILASLNDPHIAAIYGLEEVEGARFLILELVEGDTLADRLATGPLSIQDALRMAQQVAGALEAAHEKGIIHRDLKPANVAVTPAGVVKVLDFGLAKAVAGTQATGDLSLPATRTTDATNAETVVGTVAYMSPEQTRGAALDKRSDIWAFGCLLYEMVTGRRPFAGRTTFETVAAILGQDPDWSLLPPTTPARIDWLIRRCLEKDPKRRLHDIADARIEIDDVLAQGSGVGVRLESATGGVADERRPWKEPAVWAIVAGAVAATVAVTAVANRMMQPQTVEAPTIRASILPPDGVRLGVGNPPGRFAVSPDGRRIAVVASDRDGKVSLWVRPLDTDVAQPLAGTENASFPFWSPDSRSIGFLAQGKLKRIEAAGGPAVTLADATLPSTGTWNSDNVILFTPRPGSSVYRLAATGGTPVPVTALNPEKGDTQHFHPSFLPDGRHFLYFVVGSKSGGITDPRAVEVGSLDPQEPAKEIVPEGSNAKYANGHLIFIRDGTLVAQPFDTERLQLSGQPVPLVEQVQIAGAGSTGVAGSFSISETGVLAYQVGLVTPSQLTWFDRSGKQLGTLGDRADYAEVTLSADDSRAAVSILDPSAATRDLWVVDVARGLRERLTFEPSDDFAPLWSPDGSRIIYSSRRKGTIHLYERASSGSGKDQLVYEDLLGKFASDWSADGRFVAFIGGGGIVFRSDIWVLSLSGERKARPFVESSFPESHAQFSPDARWIAYMSADSGRQELYVGSYPGASERRRVSTAGGGWPRWRHNGKELFYLAPDGTLMAVPVDGQSSTFTSAPGRALFKTRLRPVVRLDAALYDVSADGQRFLMNTFVEEMTSPAIQLVVNWPAGLEK